ncbi:hypothetical protein HPB52_024700 [Rhipicephalus sanguineus]|uniref:Uncharacterized protein n=1 Tax=Rhipicephalus sanguineus TaxID=34632 RepID=A0A9D4T4Z4_RHISA|nr:hypothetical protein HPB52_003096 [Rhipicephalus sanguineus]KAH7986830.1 hypothetical protein HPB52_024700 [Rhipicephalus sanguineus]
MKNNITSISSAADDRSCALNIFAKGFLIKVGVNTMKDARVGTIAGDFGSNGDVTNGGDVKKFGHASARSNVNCDNVTMKVHSDLHGTSDMGALGRNSVSGESKEIIAPSFWNERG